MLVPSKEPAISQPELITTIQTLNGFFSNAEIDAIQPAEPAAVYTTSVTLWMMALQRLSGGSTLFGIVTK